MDTSKYKSVATKMDTYNKAKIIANHSHRSIGLLSPCWLIKSGINKSHKLKKN